MTEETKKELVAQAKQMPPKALEIAQQLKLMITNGKKLTPEEVMALANFAYREGLDPLNGECWILKSDSKGTIGCMVGIKGLRRKASEALGTEDVWYPEFRDITQTYDPTDEKVLHAYECTIRNTRATARWLTLQNGIDRKNYTSEQIIEIFGHPPMWKGIGVVHQGEYMPANYPPTTKAKKRAEAAAINAMMGFGYEIMDDEGNVIDVMPKQETIATATEPVKVTVTNVTDGKTISEGEFTNEPTAEAEVDEAFKIKNDLTSIAFDTFQTAEVMDPGKKGVLIGTIEILLSPGDAGMKRHQLTKFIFNKASFKELHAGELQALWDYVKPQKDSGGAYIGSPEAEKGFNTIMARLAAQPGQQDLFSGDTAG